MGSGSVGAIMPKKNQPKKKPLQVAFDMGKNAFYRGIFDSPYKKTSFLHKEWQRGFNAGYFENRDQQIKRAN
jgi:hypothetical protein